MSREFNDNGTTWTFNIPKYAGYYSLGGTSFAVNKKPSWFQRFIVKYLLGWTWVDTKN